MYLILEETPSFSLSCLNTCISVTPNESCILNFHFTPMTYESVTKGAFLCGCREKSENSRKPEKQRERCPLLCLLSASRQNCPGRLEVGCRERCIFSLRAWGLFWDRSVSKTERLTIATLSKWLGVTEHWHHSWWKQNLSDLSLCVNVCVYVCVCVCLCVCVCVWFYSDRHRMKRRCLPTAACNLCSPSSRLQRGN